MDRRNDPCRYSTKYRNWPVSSGMKRIRNVRPSGESQNPSTGHRRRPSVVSNQPRSDASVNGFAALGQPTVATTSTKPYRSTCAAGGWKVTDVRVPVERHPKKPTETVRATMMPSPTTGRLFHQPVRSDDSDVNDLAFMASSGHPSDRISRRSSIRGMKKRGATADAGLARSTSRRRQTRSTDAVVSSSPSTALRWT